MRNHTIKFFKKMSFLLYSWLIFILKTFITCENTMWVKLFIRGNFFFLFFFLENLLIFYLKENVKWDVLVCSLYSSTDCNSLGENYIKKTVLVKFYIYLQKYFENFNLILIKNITYFTAPIFLSLSHKFSILLFFFSLYEIIKYTVVFIVESPNSARRPISSFKEHTYLNCCQFLNTTSPVNSFQWWGSRLLLLFSLRNKLERESYSQKLWNVCF